MRSSCSPAWLRQSDRRVTFPIAGRSCGLQVSDEHTHVPRRRRARAAVRAAAACRRQSDLPGGGRRPAARAAFLARAPTIHLVSDVSSGEWRMPAGDYGNLRYSTLDTIKTTNVMNLHVVTTFSTGVPHGHEGQPLVFGNTMYVVTPFPNNLIAVDLTKPGGAVKWIYEPHPDPRAVGIACCDVVNRGASFGDGKIIYSLLDATVVAVDAETGKEAWRTRVGDINNGETFTGAPIVVKDQVLVGNSGGELGVRGYVAALDVDDRQGALARVQHRPGRRREDRPGLPRLLRQGSGEGSRRHLVAVGAMEARRIARSGAGSRTTRRRTCSSTAPANPGVWNPDLRPGRQQVVVDDLRARRRHRRGALGLPGRPRTTRGTTTRSWRTCSSTWTTAAARAS